MYFTAVIIFHYLLIISGCFLIGQVETDKPISSCGHTFYSNRLLEMKSSLTQNQEKIDVTYYRIDIQINLDKEEINGAVLISGVLGMDKPDNIELDLSGNMEVDSVKLFNELQSFTHENSLLKIPASVFSLSETYEFSVEVFYHGTPSSTGFGSFNFDTHDNIDHIWTLSEPYGARDWWPCKDDPSDKADSVDIIITVPEPQIVVSNGIMVEDVALDNNRRRYHWREGYPISTYLVSITSYPYTVWYDEYIGINGDTLPLTYYVYPDHYSETYNNYLLTKEMMTVFSQHFGEYPFMGEKYGHVEFGWGGGMEHQTISSMGSANEFLIAHELGHQWWGDLLTCASFHHIWLNEGFARYSESIWEEAYYGKDAYHDYWKSHEFYGPGSIYVENPITAGEIFNVNLSYNKAGWVIHMLRGILGDSIFFNVLKSYAYNDSLSYNSVTTEDFQNVCEDVSGIDLDKFFNQWIYGERYPKYAVSWEKLDTQELIVTIDQTQNWQIFSMPVQLRVILVNDTLDYILKNSEVSEEYNLGIIGLSSFNVILDPDDWILKEVEYLSEGYELPGPTQITLNPAYPNPFNGSAIISFFIPETKGQTQASVKIYDLKGRLIEDLWEGKTNIGSNKFRWMANGRTSGLYFVKLDVDDKHFSQKLQYIK